MIIAYDDCTQEMAMELKKLGFTVVNCASAEFYDSYIYTIRTAECLRSMIEHNENIFLLNISNLCAEEVARILQSHLHSAVIDKPSNF